MVDPQIVEQMVVNEADMAYRRRVKTIFEWLDPTEYDRILDAGTGRGFYLGFLQRACDAELVGIELDRDYLGIAQAALPSDPNRLLTNANLYNLPFAKDSFDKVILSEVLEHVGDDVAALESLHRVMRPGGLLVITVPNANYPFMWDPINKTLETFFNTHIQRGVLAGIWANHMRLYTSDSLHDAVKQAGFEIAEERSFTHYSFPFIHNIVYGFGKTILEAGLLPQSMATAADRHNTTGTRGSRLNPVNVGLRLFEWFDRRNQMHEPPDRSTVNLCVLARKPI